MEPNNPDENVGAAAELGESTKLIHGDSESQGSSNGTGASGSPQDDDSELWKEMDAPWPATFERAISLLASPVIKAETAKDLTKSPKPGNTPIAIRRRLMVSLSVRKILCMTYLISPSHCHVLCHDK